MRGTVCESRRSPIDTSRFHTARNVSSLLIIPVKEIASLLSGIMRLISVTNSNKWAKNGLWRRKHWGRVWLIILRIVKIHFNSKWMTIALVTARKRRLGQGNVFTPVCQSFCSRGGVYLWVWGVSASGSGGYTPLDTHTPSGHTPKHTPWTPTHPHGHPPDTHTHTHPLDPHR